MSATNAAWPCPWCHSEATLPGNASVICESRRCSCGALALAAPPRDTDEIIDDAINVFGIADEYLTPFDADRIAGLRQAGVDVAEGQGIQSNVDSRLDCRVLWFRRRGVSS